MAVSPSASLSPSTSVSPSSSESPAFEPTQTDITIQQQEDNIPVTKAPSVDLTIID